MTEDTQDTVSEKINSTTADSGEQMSSADVQNTVKIIDDILDAPDLEISDATLDNLISTIDNVQTKTDVNELRVDDTSDQLRESAVKVVAEVAEGGETYIPSNSVGEYVIPIRRYTCSLAELCCTSITV